MIKNADCYRVFSMGADQMKRLEVEEWTHNFEISSLSHKSSSLRVKVGRNGKQVMREQISEKLRSSNAAL